MAAADHHGDEIRQQQPWSAPIVKIKAAGRTRGGGGGAGGGWWGGGGGGVYGEDTCYIVVQDSLCGLLVCCQLGAGTKNTLDCNNNNNNRIQRRYSRFFTISSQCCKLSPARTTKWPGRNRVQITCNTSSAHHVQVSCYVPLGTKGQLSF